ncbi:MAG: hypothetical protein ACRD03_15235 [Acidimicrobiales bacterium]
MFRWHVVGDTPAFRYTTLGRGERGWPGSWTPVASSRTGPAHWSIYFGIDDTVVELGGSILTAAEDTPYGRLAAAADPIGARFTLVGPSAAMPANAS